MYNEIPFLTREGGTELVKIWNYELFLKNLNSIIFKYIYAGILVMKSDPVFVLGDLIKEEIKVVYNQLINRRKKWAFLK